MFLVYILKFTMYFIITHYNILWQTCMIYIIIKQLLKASNLLFLLHKRVKEIAF